MDDEQRDRRTRPLENGAENSPESGVSAPADGTILSRRKVLGGALALGGTGALTVAGTRAFESDREEADNSIDGGQLDLGLAWRTVYDPVDGDARPVASEGDCEEGVFVDDSGPAIRLSEIQPGDSGVTEVCLHPGDDPAWLWAGADCPESGLEDVLEAKVRFAADCDPTTDPKTMILSSGEATTEVTGSLFEVLSTLADGVRLGEECVAGGSTSCLRFEWEFPLPEADEEYEKYEGSEAEFLLEFQASQCRHNENPTNAFDRECDT